jgi:hypothetical protein
MAKFWRKFNVGKVADRNNFSFSFNFLLSRFLLLVLWNSSARGVTCLALPTGRQVHDFCRPEGSNRHFQ